MVDPKKLYRSGEITHFTGLSRQTIHLYNQLGLIKEYKVTSSGQKLYDESVFQVIEKIQHHKKHKLTLMQIKNKLRKDAQLEFSFFSQGEK